MHGLPQRHVLRVCILAHSVAAPVPAARGPIVTILIREHVVPAAFGKGSIASCVAEATIGGAAGLRAVTRRRGWHEEAAVARRTGVGEEVIHARIGHTRRLLARALLRSYPLERVAAPRRAAVAGWLALRSTVRVPQRRCEGIVARTRRRASRWQRRARARLR